MFDSENGAGILMSSDESIPDIRRRKAGADTLMLMQATGLTKEELEEIRNNMLTTK